MMRTASRQAGQQLVCPSREAESASSWETLQTTWISLDMSHRCPRSGRQREVGADPVQAVATN